MSEAIKVATLVIVLAYTTMPAIARAEEAGTQIECSTHTETADYEITYRAYFTLSEGRLIPADGNSISVKAHPMKRAFAPGFSAHTPDPTTEDFNESDNYVALGLTDEDYGPTFSVRMNVAVPPQTGRLRIVVGQALPPAGDIAVDIHPLEGQTISAVGTFEPKVNAAVRTQPFILDVVLDDKVVAHLVYNLSAVPWQAFYQGEDARYAGAKDVKADANGRTQVMGCNVFDDEM